MDVSSEERAELEVAWLGLGLGLGIEAKLDSHPPEFSLIVAIMA